MSRERLCSCFFFNFNRNDMPVDQDNKNKKKKKKKNDINIAIGCSVGIILLIVLVLGLGFGLGWFSSGGDDDGDNDETGRRTLARDEPGTKNDDSVLSTMEGNTYTFYDNNCYRVVIGGRVTADEHASEDDCVATSGSVVNTCIGGPEIICNSNADCSSICTGTFKCSHNSYPPPACDDPVDGKANCADLTAQNLKDICESNDNWSEGDPCDCTNVGR